MATLVISGVGEKVGESDINRYTHTDVAVSVVIIAADGQHKMFGVSVTKYTGFGISSRSSKAFEGFSSILAFTY